MSIDIVEIGLERMSDHVDFEKLATEILYNEGYYDIIPLPGGSEFGQDAFQESFFIDNETKKIVFQYTLQEYFKGKVKKTIERLNEAKIEFNELVIVTKHKISGETQIIIKADVRKEYSKPITIIERETVINRLSNFENGIFYRHFPDIDKQILNFQRQKSILEKESSKPFEKSMLIISIAFTFCNNSGSIRNEVFDNLILACIYELNKNETTIEEIKDVYSKVINKSTIPDEQIKAALRRLNSKDLIDYKNSIIKTTKKTNNLVISNTITSNQLTSSLINDIADKVIDEYDKLDKKSIERIKRNTLEVLSDIFQMHGLEIANHFILDEINYVDVYNTEQTIKKAKHQIPDEVGEYLVTIIANIFKNPTKEQAITLANWSKAYLGVKIMNYDPTLKELQLTHFRKKIFILDTDFLLNCIIQERPSQNFYYGLLESMSILNCSIIIPETVITECIDNAKRAINTYTFFGNSLFSLNDDFVDTMIGNLFVQGYYYKYRQSTKKLNFRNYIENYYDNDEPNAFFIDLIKTYLPKNIEIKTLDSFNIKYPAEQFTAIKKSLINRLKLSRKAKYRTDEQSEELADTDARLFLTTYYLNKSESKSNSVLGGKAYLVTLSQRFIKCAKENNIKDIVTNNPHTLAALLDIVTNQTYSPSEFIKSFDNPLYMQ